MSDNRESWLNGIIGPDTVTVDGEPIAVARKHINLVGATQEDDPSNDATNVILPGTDTVGPAGSIQTSDGAGGVGVPITPTDGALVGTTDEQALENKTLVAPKITGSPSFAGDSDVVLDSEVASVTTTNTTPTPLYFDQVSEGQTMGYSAIVVWSTSNGKAGMARRTWLVDWPSAGSAAVVGAVEGASADIETTSGDTVGVTVSAIGEVAVTVTAADSDTRLWTAEVRRQGIPAE